MLKDFCEPTYHCDEVLGKWIIYPSELELIPENYPILLLAQGEKLKQFMALCLREELEEYYQLIIDIGLLTDPSVILQKIWEFNKMKYHIQEETWPAIDRFFQEMPEAFGKLPTFREALQQHAQSVQQQALRQGLQQGELIGEQRALIRFIRCKFPQVSNSIVQHIEATHDIKQLNNWLEQIVSANELTEIDFKVPTAQKAQTGLNQ